MGKWICILVHNSLQYAHIATSLMQHLLKIWLEKFFGTRIPILSFPFVKTVADHQPITVDDIIDLMNAKTLPERFPLDKLPDEKLKSDYRKNFESSLKFTLKLLGIIGVIGGIYSFLDSEE